MQVNALLDALSPHHHTSHLRTRQRRRRGHRPRAACPRCGACYPCRPRLHPSPGDSSAPAPGSMEVVLGALPSLLPKLSDLLADEYNLQKEVKGGIRFLRAELESMKAALEDISKAPPDQLQSRNKIWARNVRELSYDIEDSIDTFMVQVKGRHQPAKKHGIKKFLDRALGSLMEPKIRRRMAIDIRDIKSRVIEVHDRRHRYEVNHCIDKPVKIDPRALVRYENVTELVGIEESRDEVINILIEGDEGSKEQNKIVSIVGLGGLGKTTLANAVYEKLRAQFDCSAFVSVSQTPDMDRLFKDMFYQLAKYSTASINVIDEIRGFLREKRYLVIIDDIWESSYWKMIRCALPNDSIDSRIITTTRNFKVAKEIGGLYKMKPLSLENSKILMYRRIFGKKNKDKCPDEQLEEVSNRVLKKCDGVPLAIITISSLLASKGRNKFEWFDVCSSIGAGLVENNSVENMRKVLSLSYYDMPCYLRTCMLYFSMFPEDYDIQKDRLIWLWIAEGFIHYEKQDKSLLEIGENYLNELINRNMIQPKHDEWSGMIESCRVHDMVMDLICSLSSEENFVTIQNNRGHSSESKKVRRLSLQNSKASYGQPEAILSKEHHVRSVIVFQSAIDYIPMVLGNFSILRVLDLEGCDLSQSNSLKYLGNLLHLRYLCLRNTEIGQLPDEIGNLTFLQMLDVQTSYGKEAIPSLPSSIVRLTQLMCLRINRRTRVTQGIGSLIALEELSCLCIDCEGKMLEELSHLTKLKVLDLEIITGNLSDLHLRQSQLESDDSVVKSVVECLNKLHKIQSLGITTQHRECNLDGWVVTAPENLRRVQVCGPCWFATLPVWLKVNPSLFLNLSLLQIGVKRLQQEDLEILGMLPALYYLNLRVVGHEDLGIHGKLVVGACLFPCLVRCGLLEFGGPVVFEQGAMPRLVELEFDFPVLRTREINGSFDLGLGNLLSLQRVTVWLQSEGASEEEERKAKAVMMHTIQVHPNHPTLYRYN